MSQPSTGASAALAAGDRPGWLAVVRILQRAAVNFHEDRGSHMAAAIAYYGLFSLFPLVTLVVSLFGIVMRDEARRAAVVQALVNTLPVEAGGISDSLLAVAERGPTLTVVAGLGTVWSASALLSAVRSSLSVAFAEDRGRPPLQGKVLDLLQAPIMGSAFLLSLTLTTSWRVLQSATEARVPLLGDRLGWAWDLGASALPVVLVFLAFLGAYRVLPARHLPLRHLWGGALLATLGFELVKWGFAVYIANFAYYDLVYGSLGGVVALLFWVYLSANMLLIGAEVAAETGHVLRGEPRHGRVQPPGEVQSARSAMWGFLVGLVLAPGDGTSPVRADPDSPRSTGRDVSEGGRRAG